LALPRLKTYYRLTFRLEICPLQLAIHPPTTWCHPLLAILLLVIWYHLELASPLLRTYHHLIIHLKISLLQLVFLPPVIKHPHPLGIVLEVIQLVSPPREIKALRPILLLIWSHLLKINHPRLALLAQKIHFAHFQHSCSLGS
jgi:hypothetical protein